MMVYTLQSYKKEKGGLDENKNKEGGTRDHRNEKWNMKEKEYKLARNKLEGRDEGWKEGSKERIIKVCTCMIN